MTKNWVAAVGRQESPEEKGAYERMQNAFIASSSSEPQDNLMRLEQQEGKTIDLLTLKGRIERSHRNLRYLREANADCPKALLKKLKEAVIQSNCTLFFTPNTYYSKSEDITRPETIFKDGKLLSNAALIAAGKAVNGGTDGHDDTHFGNTDFVFTRPIFSAENSPLRCSGDGFYMPGNALLSNQYAWLSFQDWMASRDEYCGYHGEGSHFEKGAHHKKNSSSNTISDFYIGSDIAEAIALKIYEGIKTSILLYPDSESLNGFSLQKANAFLDIPKNNNSERTWLLQTGANKLKSPLSKLDLNEKQRAFLLQSTERDAFIEKAISSTFTKMRYFGEVKVPRFISLDGADYIQEHGFDGGKLDKPFFVHLSSTPDQHNDKTLPWDFDPQTSAEYSTHVVAPDSRSYAYSNQVVKI